MYTSRIEQPSVAAVEYVPEVAFVPATETTLEVPYSPAVEAVPAQEAVYGFYTTYDEVDASGVPVTLLQKECLGTITEINSRIADSQAKLDAIAAIG